MRRLDDIKAIIPPKEKKDAISKNFREVMKLIIRYNPRYYPSANPVEYDKKDDPDYDNAA